ncbi:phosphatidylglycerophosphatase A [Lentilactobacillus raoultii]|uniref:Phosphatidylglycerophosphatase A n=1 Tax=Lentilactobacillus raoultii TaxID=1987503 RepID=A0ABW3PP73_9LACO|nr:phosphatidylglycerophosphatase A [Lentilactobacillus raoultii]
MNNKNFKFPDTKAYNFVIKALKERGITPDDISQMAINLQKPFIPNLTMEEVRKDTTNVLHKREVLNNAMVGLELDRLASEGQLQEPLESIIMNDSGVFGVDEGIALNIANIYGTIGITNYGYIDRDKTGVIKKLDEAKNGTSYTFIDDIVGAIASAVSARIAHRNN